MGAHPRDGHAVLTHQTRDVRPQRGELRRERAIILYQEGNHAWRVRIDNYEVVPMKWTDDGDWLEVTMKLRLLSV